MEQEDEQDPEEKLLWDAHDKEGKKRFKRRWEKCNFGWYTEDYSISSKVYGSNPQVLMSYMDPVTKRITHKQEDY